MVKLDEAKKYKWNLKYQIIKDTKLETIIEGKYYDFIPNKGDIIVLENNAYVIGNKIIDFDNSNILLNISYLKNIEE